jgi:hypothetical protein
MDKKIQVDYKSKTKKGEGSQDAAKKLAQKPDKKTFKDFMKTVKESLAEMDSITLNVPLFIRLLEHAREDVKEDVELHVMAENCLELQEDGSDILSMDDYEAIVGKSLVKEDAPANAAGGGNIAGIGVGAKGEPGGKSKLGMVRRKQPKQVTEGYTVKKTSDEKEDRDNDGYSETQRTREYDIIHNKSGKKVGTMSHEDYFGNMRAKIGNRTTEISGYGKDPHSAVNKYFKSKTGQKHLAVLKKQGLHESKATHYLKDKIKTAKKPEKEALKTQLKKLKKVAVKEESESFNGHKVFEVSSDYFHNCKMGKRKYARFEDYIGNDETGQAIREYANNNYGKPIIVQDATTGAMCYLRYGNAQLGK